MYQIASYLQDIADLNNLANAQGMSQTAIPGVYVFRTTDTVARTPVVYEPGIVIIGQGRKIGYWGDQAIQYDAENYLVPTVPMPLECETHASEDEPLLGLFIDIDMDTLYELVNKLASRVPGRQYDMPDLIAGIGAAVMDARLKDVVTRLLICLKSPLDAQILGPGIVHEILYRVLLGERGSTLFALAQHNGPYSRIAKVLNRIHQDFHLPLTIDELAHDAGMSVSSFHRAFKQVTVESPLQYLKKIRLSKAKSMIVHEGMRANIAANRVGYESAAQFSREFKRLFGVPPSQSKDIGYAELM
jgi:AraC-like DNA-binding protein